VQLIRQKRFSCTITTTSRLAAESLGALAALGGTRSGSHTLKLPLFWSQYSLCCKYRTSQKVAF